MCYYLGDSHSCPEIPRNKLKHYFHMLLHSAISALSFHRMVHGNCCFHLVKWSETRFGQISVLISAHDRTVLGKIDIRIGSGGTFLLTQQLRGRKQIQESKVNHGYRKWESWATWAPWDLTLKKKKEGMKEKKWN